VGRIDPSGLSRFAGRYLHLSLQVSSHRTGRSRTTHQGDLPDPCPLRLSVCHAAPGRLADQSKEDAADLSWLGLQLCNKTPRRRLKAKLQEDRRNATRPNETWAMDFVHDQLATGRKLRILTIVDTFSRFSPALVPRLTLRGADAVVVLERVGPEVGLPSAIRVDQGTEFVSRDLDLWAYQRGVVLDFSRSGKPPDNAFIEALNGRSRVECLNAHWFLSPADVREKMEDWRKCYNEERPIRDLCGCKFFLLLCCPGL
jgi:putative transposase